MKETVVSGFLYNTNIPNINLILKELLDDGKIKTKYRIMGEQIDYEDNLFEIFIEGNDYNSNYTISMSIQSDLIQAEVFLKKLANFFLNAGIKYEFEYNEQEGDIEGEEYQLYHPDLL